MSGNSTITIALPLELQKGTQLRGISQVQQDSFPHEAPQNVDLVVLVTMEIRYMYAKHG